MIIYVGHVVSALVFLAVGITAIYMAMTLKASTLPPCYLWVPRVVIILLLMQSTVFLLLQADYLIGSHGVLDMEDPIGPANILYTILNGITLVIFATGLNIFFRWKHKPVGCIVGCPLEGKYDRLNKS